MRYRVLRGWCLGRGIDVHPGQAIYSPGNAARAKPDMRMPQISEATARVKLSMGLIRPWPEESAPAAASEPDLLDMDQEIDEGQEPTLDAKPKGRRGRKKETDQ